MLRTLVDDDEDVDDEVPPRKTKTLPNGGPSANTRSSSAGGLKDCHGMNLRTLIWP